MLPRHKALSLSRTMFDEDAVVLVASTTWLGLRAEGGYHEVDTRKALWMLENLDHRRQMDIRAFVAEARVSSFPLSQLRDHAVLELLRNAIRDGRLIAIQKGGAATKAPSTTVELRRLVAEIEKATRGKLPYRGRQHKLVVDVGFASLPGRDYYEVASQSEARAVLDGIAKESPASADLLKQASEKLSKDWRPPFQPDGLVLLRRIPVQATAPKDDGPALSPSQMKDLLQKEELVLELEHLYHDDEPVHEAPFTVELSDGSTVKGQLDAKGKATVRVSVTPIRVRFGPDSRPWEKVDQTANPDYQEKLDVDAFINSRLAPST
jgi:hypothetical protein